MEIPTHTEDTRKLAILGLGNAGKTSIIKTILYEFRAFAHLLPTTGVDRTNIEFFGHELVIWDFGGQDQYREIYLTRPIMYFQGIRYLYYVVDAQEPETLQKSIDYFKKILSTAIEFSEDMKVYLFFHKVDPEFIGKVDFSKVENDFINAVVDDLAQHQINPVVFHTSIFNPISVISGFAQPLLGNKTIYDTLCDVVDSFCWDRDLPFGMIFVNKLEIGSYFASKAVYNYLVSHIIEYLDWLDEGEEISKYEMGDYDVITKQFHIEVGDSIFDFYYTIGVDQLFEPEDIEDLFEDMENFIIDLEKILQNSEIIRSGELLTREIFSEEILETRRQHKEMQTELEGLDEEDRNKDIFRKRQLDDMDDQYQDMRETNPEENFDKKEKYDEDDVEDEDKDDEFI